MKEVKAYKVNCENCKTTYTDPDTGQQYFEDYAKCLYPLEEQGWFVDQFHTYCPECDKKMIDVEIGYSILMFDKDEEHMFYVTRDVSVELAKDTAFSLLVKELPEYFTSGIEQLLINAKQL